MGYTTEENWLSLPSAHKLLIASYLGAGIMFSFPGYSGVLTNLILGRYCIHNHGCCASMSATALSRPEGIILLQPFPSLMSHSYNVSVPSFGCSLNLGTDRSMVQVSHLNSSTPLSLVFCTLTICEVSVCVLPAFQCYCKDSWFNSSVAFKYH